MTVTIDLRSKTFRDQVYGCWMGKNCGGTLGAPLEKAWGEPEPFDIWWYPELKEGGIPNDDLEMQLLWLKALEEVGPGLKAADLAQYWLDHIGYNWDEYGLSKTNLRLGLLPPVSGYYNNWFKDCMGCPIRSEIWACVAPGAPRVAVRYAYEDAICDHAGGESVYGELFNTAVEAAAFVVSDRLQLIEIGLSYVPAGSQTEKAIRAAIAAHADGVSWQEARQRVLQATPHYNAQYSPINIGFQVLGWLYGEDFGDALCKTVNCGYDTDCTGATLGSVLGIIATRHGLPQKWTEPLGEGISTNESWGGILNAAGGPNPVPLTLEELTARVCVMAQRVLTAHGLLDEDGCLTVDPASLYADESVRALWHVNPRQVELGGSSLQVTVDYGTLPAVAPGEVKQFATILYNPHPVEITAQCTLWAPPGWQIGEAGATRAVTVGPRERVTISWQVTAPSAAHLENSNTLYLQVQPRQRPAQAATPIVFVGARRLRMAAPYPLAGATDAELFAQVLPPEQGNGATAEGRPGSWQTAYALDNALPLPQEFTGALYVQTFLWSPVARTASIGVPGTLPRKFWVNGEEVLASCTYPPLRPNYNGDGMSYAPAPLREGWNEVLIKFVRGEGAAPAEAHLVATTDDNLRHSLVNLRWTRLPWDESGSHA